VWFGIILAMNLQTSFLTPPFGFALFYLRSVAARKDYNDPVTQQRISAVTTGQIYQGSIAFIFLQLIMVGTLMLFPGLVTDNIDKAVAVDETTVMDMLESQSMSDGSEANPLEAGALPSEDAPADGIGGVAAPVEEEVEEDPAAALLESMKKGK
jgi:hypothetical protein